MLRLQLVMSDSLHITSQDFERPSMLVNVNMIERGNKPAIVRGDFVPAMIGRVREGWRD